MNKKINILFVTSLLIFSVFYNIGAGVFLMINTSPQIFNFISKLIGFSFSLVLILKYFQINNIRVNIFSIPLFSFLFIYSTRLLVDIFIRNLTSTYSNVLIFSYFFGGIIAIVVSIVAVHKFINTRFILNLFIYYLCIANFIIFLLIIKSSQFNFITLFSQRLSFGIEESDSNDIINSITISMNASLLLLYFFYETNFRIKLIKQNIYLRTFLLVISVLNLLLSGSRGPFVSLIFIIIVMFIQKNKLNIYKIFSLTFIFVITIVILLSVFNIDLWDLNFIQRIYSNEEFVLLNDDNRFDLYNSALKQFKLNPIFGDKYFENITGTYPHNIFLEVLMSTGLIGFLFFILHLLSLVIIYIKKFKHFSEKTFLFYLTFFYFFCSLFSSSIWGNVEFFIFSALMTHKYQSIYQTS